MYAYNYKIKKRITGKQKSRCSDKFLIAATLTPPRQNKKKSNISKSDVSKKETVHKRHCRPIIDLRFHPGEKFALIKNAFNKALNFHPARYDIELLLYCRLHYPYRC
jgi:hypothetical protein